MKINRNAIVQGTDGTELKVLSHVSNRGFCKVKVLKVGNLLEVRQGQEIGGFDVYHGVIKFEEKAA